MCRHRRARRYAGLVFVSCRHAFDPGAMQARVGFGLVLSHVARDDATDRVIADAIDAATHLLSGGLDGRGLGSGQPRVGPISASTQPSGHEAVL